MENFNNVVPPSRDNLCKLISIQPYRYIVFLTKLGSYSVYCFMSHQHPLTEYVHSLLAVVF